MDDSEAERRELLRQALSDLQQHIDGKKELKTFTVSTEPDTTISDVLRELGLTLEQLATAVGISSSVLRDWDADEEKMPREFRKLLSLLDIFSDDADQIFQEIRRARLGDH